MSFGNNPEAYGKEIDPLTHIQNKNKFYSLTNKIADSESGLFDYCQFCLLNFHRFHNMVLNVCQVCGRVAEPIRKDKQDNLAVTSVNSSATPVSVRAVSMDIDYTPITHDPTQSLSPRDGEVMTANSIGEAMRKLRWAEKSTSRLARAALTGQKFIVKFTGTGDKQKVQFDNNF